MLKVMSRAFRRGRLSALLGVLSVVLVAGCTIKPEPLTDAERGAEVATDRAGMYPSEALAGPLTLDGALARALKYNLDGRVKLMEEGLAADELDVSRWDLMPKVVSGAGYFTRNNHNAASSEALKTGTQSLVPSFSTDRDWYTADLTVSWNILDFGVSYYTARQTANRVLVAGEHRRKAIDNLFQDVRAAYFRVAGAQATAGRAAEAVAAAEDALARSRQAEREGLRRPLESLFYQRSLLELIRLLEDERQRLVLAKNDLALLIDLPPGEDFTVELPEGEALVVPQLKTPIGELEEVALLHNPDLLELSYEGRISAEETRKTLVKLLPGLNLSYGPQFDSTSFLVHNFWAQGAAQVSWNLLNVVTFPDRLAYAHAAEKLVAAQRVALSVATLTKLHIAYQEFQYAKARFARAKEASAVDERIYAQARNRAAADAQGTLERISAEASAVLSELRVYDSYAELEAALGRIYATLGVASTPELIAASDLKTLTRAIAALQASLQKGEIDGVLPPDPQSSAVPPLPETLVKPRDPRAIDMGKSE